MSPIPIAIQPSKHTYMQQEKNEGWSKSNEHSSCESQCTHHSSCHKQRTRRALMLAMSSFLTLVFLLFMSMSDFTGSETGLFKRQNTGTGTGTQDVFVKNKLYLIVIIVGLFVCLILGVMLSAWCCRGVFSNPICCPCYLCACCGGLACLECISCGLCAEGFEQL